MAKEAKFPLLPRLTLRALRFASGWSEATLAAAVGTSADFIGQMELGNRKITPENFLRFVRVMGFEPEQVELVMQGLRWLVEPGGMAADRFELGSDQAALRCAAAEAEVLRSELPRLAESLRVQRERQRAEGLCRLLVGASAAQRRLIFASTRGWDSWAVVEGLCEASIRAAAQDARKSLARAELALRVAEASRAEETTAKRLQGYTWAFVGNAQRVGNDLGRADQSFANAWRLWPEAKEAKGIPLEEWRLLDLEASLRRDQRRWPEALGLLGRAEETAPADVQGRILLNRAFALEQLGNPEQALEALRRAEPLLDEKRDPRLFWVLRFNEAVNLIDLQRAPEAAALLPEVQRRVERLGNELDLLRTLWLRGRADAALGREEQALAALEQVLRAFSARGLAYDAALAGLDLAALRLERAEHSEVRCLAEAMIWLFEAKDFARESLAALALFREAALAESATAVLARQTWASIKRAGFLSASPAGA